MKDRRSPRNVVLVFTNHRAHWWQRILRSGFRHCFAAYHDGRRWISLDPLKGSLLLAVLEIPAEFDLARFYAKRGHHVLSGRISARPTAARMMLEPLTCVSVMKRLIVSAMGIPHGRWERLAVAMI